MSSSVGRGGAKVAAAVFSCAALFTGGAAYSVRNMRVRSRKDMIAAEVVKTKHQIASVEAFVKADDALLAKRKVEMDEMKETVATLWEDRLCRYQKSVEDCEAFIKVGIPQGLKTIQKLGHEADRVAALLPSFIHFDYATSKLHNLSLLLTVCKKALAGQPLPSLPQQQQEAKTDVATVKAKEVTVKQIMRHIRALFASEEFVVDVCDAVERTQCDCRDGAAASITLPELSKTFQFASRAMASEFLHSETEHHKKMSHGNANDAAANVHHSVQIYPSLPSRAAAYALNLLKFTTKSNSKATTAAVLEDCHFGPLRDREDIEAAIQFVSKFDKLEKAEAPWLATEEKSRAALAQLRLWQDAAKEWLIHCQAVEALDAYNLIMAKAMAEVIEEK